MVKSTFWLAHVPNSTPPPQAGLFQRLGGSACLCGAEETLGEAKGAAVMAEIAFALWTGSEPRGENVFF